LAELGVDNNTEKCYALLVELLVMSCNDSQNRPGLFWGSEWRFYQDFGGNVWFKLWHSPLINPTHNILPAHTTFICTFAQTLILQWWDAGSKT